jgi:virginiamycin B lyase
MREILLYTDDEAAAASSVSAAGGRMLHVFSPRAFVAELPDGVTAERLASVSTVAPSDLDEFSSMAAGAWHQTTLQRNVRSILAPGKSGKAGEPVIPYLTGKVAVGIVSVSGSPPWSEQPGVLRWVSAGNDGTVCGVNNGNDVFKWNGKDWSPLPGALRQISVADAKTMWGTNRAGGVFKWNGNDWDPKPGKLVDVAAAADGTVWGIDSGDNVLRWTGSDWGQMPGALVQISVADADTAWGVNRKGNVYKWNGSDWTPMPGGLTNVSVATDGSVFGINSAGTVFRYVKAANPWQPMPGGVLKQISAASAKDLWAVNSSNTVYRGDAASGLGFSEGEFTNIVVRVGAGLDQYLSQTEPLANVTFVYDMPKVSISATPGPDPSISDPTEAMEAPWRNAALVSLGYEGSPSGSAAYADHIKALKGADWALVGYVTKYPLAMSEYAKDERIVMNYGENVREVFTRLTCTFFGAASESGACTCGPSGHFNIPNGNCINCTSSQSPCLMNTNKLELCGLTRMQLGWSSWGQRPGGLKWISTAESRDGVPDEVWGVNSKGNVFRWNGSDWSPKPGTLVQISVASADTLWGVNSSDEVFSWNGSDWSPMPGWLKQVSVGRAGFVWGLNSSNEVFQWNGSDWSPRPGALSDISAASDGTVWGVNLDGEVFRWNGSDWSPMPGAPTGMMFRVSVSKTDPASKVESVWGVARGDGNIYRWNGNIWQQAPGALRGIANGGPKNIWGLDVSGNVLQRQVLGTP